MTLDDKSFLRIVKNTPLVSIDLIIINREGNVLLGKRRNQPAKDFWFVPGSRIKKDERIEFTFPKITKNEIKENINLENTNFIGVYEHIYDENFKGVKGISTHYVVLAVEILTDQEIDLSPNDQHSEFRWWSKNHLLTHNEVHPYTKAYFDESNLTKVFTCK